MTLDEFVKRVKKCTTDSGSYSLEWDPHKPTYDTVREYLSHHLEDVVDLDKCIELDSVVAFQWYPKGSVSFEFVSASSIGIVIEAALNRNPELLEVDL